MNTFDFSVKNAKGEMQSLGQYRGKALLIVNVASECGFTSQYEGLQKLYETYQAQGLEILAFPCNQFGGQEPGSDSEVQNFCTGRFGVKFPVLSKIEVNGDGADPLFTHLKKEAKGVLGTEAIKWNFTKFLVDRSGKVLKRFGSIDKPKDLSAEIEQALR